MMTLLYISQYKSLAYLASSHRDRPSATIVVAYRGRILTVAAALLNMVTYRGRVLTVVAALLNVVIYRDGALTVAPPQSKEKNKNSELSSASKQL